MTNLEYLTKTWLTYSQDTMCIPADILTDFECGERNAIGLVRPLVVALEQRVQEAEAEAKRWRGRHVKAVELLEQAEARAEELRRERDRWEWALDYVLGEARAVDLYYDIPEARIGDTADVKRCLLARYQPVDEEGR